MKTQERLNKAWLGFYAGSDQQARLAELSNPAVYRVTRFERLRLRVLVLKSKIKQLPLAVADRVLKCWLQLRGVDVNRLQKRWW